MLVLTSKHWPCIIKRPLQRQAAMLGDRPSKQNGLSKQLLLPHQLLIITLIANAIACASMLISNRLSGSSGGIQDRKEPCMIDLTNTAPLTFDVNKRIAERVVSTTSCVGPCAPIAL